MPRDGWPRNARILSRCATRPFVKWNKAIIESVWCKMSLSGERQVIPQKLNTSHWNPVALFNQVTRSRRIYLKNVCPVLIFSFENFSALGEQSRKKSSRSSDSTDSTRLVKQRDPRRRATRGSRSLALSPCKTYFLPLVFLSRWKRTHYQSAASEYKNANVPSSQRSRTLETNVEMDFWWYSETHPSCRALERIVRVNK